MDLRNSHKRPPIAFGNVKRIKADLSQQQRAKRKTRRTQNFEDNRRGVSPGSAISQNVVTETHRKKLSDWRAERRSNRETQKSQKKPPFVVGIVRHHFYSPISKVAPVKKKKTVQGQTSSEITKRITKATEKRLQTKAANAATKPLTISTKKTSTTEIPADNKVKSGVVKRKSFAPVNHKFGPPPGLPQISLSRKACKNSPFLNKHIFARDKLTKTAVQEPVCSCVSTEASTVKAPSLGLSLPTFLEMEKEETNNELTTKHMEHSGTPIKKRYVYVGTFKATLNEERNKLQKLCEDWRQIQSEDHNNITEDIRYQINQAVGQTTMLMNGKFKQFHSLLLNYERNDDDMAVTCMDLHGFWDVIYLEVKNCRSRFAKLNKLRAGYWQEDQASFTTSTRSNEKSATKRKAVSARESLRRASIISSKTKRVAELQDNEKSSQKLLNVNNTASRNEQCKMYTSTPFPTTPLITMKVSQLYDKFSCTINSRNDRGLLVTPGQTPRKSSTEESERPGSPRRTLVRQNLNDQFTLTLNEKLVIEENSSSNSEFSGSVQTVLEKTTTFTLSSHSITPIEVQQPEERD
ncbi:PREDICTED: disks large-associated protein 5-like [Vollenhovia emeryi]|uniref:disks large-associated protein 5-like n=1 Tax=Vollenhovia emeryi TaxID=411798 RepID=UPI0005F4E591|nr:PREDICTED: disks large-associated protein 5-like [Vollenhovia emeryi]